MNRQDLTELLNALPDEWIDSAAEPEIPQKHTHFRLWVTGIAACLAVLIAAAVYPKLRVQEPGRIVTTAVTSGTTASQVSSLTTASETSQITQTGTPAVTALPVTSGSAVTETGTVSAETERTATTHTTAESVTRTAEPSGTAESAVTAQRTTAAAESTGTKTGTTAATASSENAQLSSETVKPPGTTVNAADTTANCNTQTEQTGLCATTTPMGCTTTIAIATTTVNTQAMAAQTFCPSCWIGYVPQPEVTRPEYTRPAEEPISETVAVSLEVYTDTLPELLYFDEQPEIDFTQYNAVMITAKLQYDGILLETGVISGSELSLYFLRKPDSKPAEWCRQYLIALPKEYRISSVTGQVIKALSPEQYAYALERPFTIYY